MRSSVLLGGLLLGGLLLASCTTPDTRTAAAPEAIWIKRGSDEKKSPHDNLDDLRHGPGGTTILDWRLLACTGYPDAHVPGAFVARHCDHPRVPDQQYAATGARQERNHVVWFEYEPLPTGHD